MSPRSLQTDKLIPVNLPEICAPRPELLGRFDRASVKRCIYINAPAGCGKTVSTRLWVQKSGCKPIWLGLDTYDNTPVAFYRLFCMALFSVIPQEEELSRLVKEPAFSVSPVEYTIEILSRFSFDDNRYALVLDDFQCITNEEILKSLIFVTKRIPLCVTVLILSRSGLPRLLSPLEENGKIAFIGASELAFNSFEIRRYFASYGRFITAEEADNAFSLTEGWAMAVGALVLSGNITAEENITNNPLGEYIKGQIWYKLEKALRHFMILTSFVDEFSAELCLQITDNPKSLQILEMLCSVNMFISRLNDKYRYHHLFLEFLREEAAKEAAIDQKALYQKAAGYYLKEGEHFNALRYFLKAGNSRGIATALHCFFSHNAKANSEMSKIYFINKLPSGILEENPFLYVSCAWCAFLFSDAKSMYHYLDRLYERIRDIYGEYKEFLGSVILLFAIDPRYSFIQQVAKFKAGIPFKAGNPDIPKSLAHNMPYFHRTYRDYSHYALDTEVHLNEFRHTVHALLGDDYPVIESRIRAGLFYEKNLLKEAVAALEPGLQASSPELLFLWKLQMEACLFAMGKKKEAVRCRTELQAFLEKENLLYLWPVFSAYETKLKLLDGNKAAAAAWLGNYFVTEGQTPELYKMFLHFTTIRAYTVLGEYKKAEELCEKLNKLARDFYRFLDATEAAVLLVVLRWMTGKKQGAVALLQALLSDMEPYHFIRVFADEGRAILPVLKRLLKKADNENQPVRPGCKYLQEVYLAVYEQSKRYKGIACAAVMKPVKLSAQQKHMLELLANGYNNAEIVQLTGLSINTVRSHTKVAYQKLEVSSKPDAVLRARELGLID